MDIQENVSLAPLTTFYIGGSARFFVRVKTIEELREAFAFAKEKNLAVFLLGGGSNTLFDDKGFDGLVIQVEISGIEREGALLIVGAGESWDKVVEYATQQKLWGIENLSGIPGTVGGGVVQNIGAYGASLSQTLEWAEVFDTHTGEVRRLSNKECAFDYRDSVFKHEDGRYVVLRAALRLSEEPAPNVSYKDLAQRFPDSSLDLSELRQAVLQIRASKFPDTAKEGTAGSFFKNPLLSRKDARALQVQYPEMLLFDLPESSEVKVPLAWLLDHVLILRGHRMGRARLFEHQPLVIAADRGATANEVRALAQFVQEKVKQSFNIEIEPEVHIVLP
jgi:UDP-N-acetylmuramate dehydrogenase